MVLLAAATDEVVTTFPEALVNTALGMGTVFLVLILISFIIYLMKFIPDLLDRSSAKKEVASALTPAPRPVPVPKPAPAVPAHTEDTQLVAVITAAISAAMEQEENPVPPDGLVIRSIKKRY